MFLSEQKSHSHGFDADDIIKAFNEQKPQLRNRFDALALALHIIMKKLGFEFIGCDDSKDIARNKDALIPEGWNSSTDSYCFRYKVPKTNETLVIKPLILGEKLLIHGLAGDKDYQTLEIDLNDYTRNDVPLDNYNNLFKDLNKLVLQFQMNIVNKLVPDISKGSQSQSPQRDPLRVPTQPRSPLMEGGPYYPQPVQPFGIGSDDLNPFPLRMPGGFGGHGSLVGPHHPGFGPAASDPYGRGRVFPPPPGARFDPFGPPRGQFGEPDRDEPPPPGPNYDMFL